jgi:CRP-like cAMP-binding protein
MDLRSLFKNAENVHQFRAGTVIFEEGSPGDVMYVILDGELEVRVAGECIEVVGPGEIIGEMALIDAKERSATAVAKSDCRLAPIDQKRFLFMVQQTPFFSIEVMRMLAARLRHMNAKIDE